MQDLGTLPRTPPALRPGLATGSGWCQRACLTGLLASSLVLAGCQNAAPPPPAPPPPVVDVSLPISREVTDYEDFTGGTTAFNAVEVRARVTGFLQKLCFQDGAEVEKGRVLFEIDPITLAAIVRQTEANLRQSEAHLNTMTRNFNRAQDLLQRKGISIEDYDTAVGNRDEALAAVGVAKANRDLAKINLDYAHVTAPIGGRVSRRLVDVGNIIMADSTPLTTILDLSKIYVYFDINERSFLRIQRLVREGKIPRFQDTSEQHVRKLGTLALGSIGHPQGKGSFLASSLVMSEKPRSLVQIGLADEKGYSLTGAIDFEENRLDAGTGTYRVRALVDNADRFLSAGMFVRVRLPIGLPYTPLLISEQALMSDQGQKYVYVIDAKNKVEYRRVKTGGLQDGLRVIEKLEHATGAAAKSELVGLEKGDRIVVRGMQRVRPGGSVQPELVTMPEPDHLAIPVVPQKKPEAANKAPAKLSK
jgi:multidrug efflux system membrane fusion protein